MSRRLLTGNLRFGPKAAPDTAVAAVASAASQSDSQFGSGPARLNEKQLAERWGVSVRTLQAARVKGSGVPFVRIGRSVRYRLEDVLDYEQARLRTSTSR